MDILLKNSNCVVLSIRKKKSVLREQKQVGSADSLISVLTVSRLFGLSSGVDNGSIIQEREGCGKNIYLLGFPMTYC